MTTDNNQPLESKEVQTTEIPNNKVEETVNVKPTKPVRMKRTQLEPKLENKVTEEQREENPNKYARPTLIGEHKTVDVPDSTKVTEVQFGSVTSVTDYGRGY